MRALIIILIIWIIAIFFSIAWNNAPVKTSEALNRLFQPGCALSYENGSFKCVMDGIGEDCDCFNN